MKGGKTSLKIWEPMLLANLPDSNLIFVYWQMSLQLFLVQNHFKLKEMKGN